MAVKKGGLGRGLDALFNENSTENSTVELKINDIEPNKTQPRRDFDEAALAQLADSIQKHGLLQPLLVRPMPNGIYQIVAGERRWRACRIAGLATVPAMVKEMTDCEVMEAALIENLQREDLNPVEEAMGYKSLADEYFFTQEQISESVGKSRSAIANSLRLLNLNQDETAALAEGKITAGHARTLLSAEDAEIRHQMLKEAENGASVRELEKLAKLTALSKKPKVKAKKDKFHSEVELALKNEIHRKVKIVSKGGRKGTLTIDFFSDSDLSDIAAKLAGEKK